MAPCCVQVPALPAAGPVTALELPKVDVPLPLPKKKEILPPVGLDVPVYKFKLPDIKAELLALGKDALSKLGLDKLIAAVRLIHPQIPIHSLLLPSMKEGYLPGRHEPAKTSCDLICTGTLLSACM